MSTSQQISRIGLAMLVAVGALTAACGKKEESASASERFDAAVAEAQAESKDVAHEAQAQMDAAGVAMSDAAIGVAVNAKIAQDKELEASKIDVEVNNGAVVLRGSAPSDAAVMRAVSLAKGTDGVTSVNSEIKVVSS